MTALGVRRAVVAGDTASVASFATAVVGRRGARWEEAVSTALLGDWATPFYEGGCLSITAVDGLKRDAESIHRQLLPLWRRRNYDSRVLLLDTPVGDGLCLYDLLALSPGTSPATDREDARLTRVLHALRPPERRVVLAWAHPQVETWADAAWLAGSADAQTVGERVRRRVRRLAREERRRHLNNPRGRSER